MKPSDERVIAFDYIARVEGEGSFYVKMDAGKVVESKLKIFEPPRFFEGFLAGRDFREAPDITARICGICPVAYQMTSVHAMEEICQYTVNPLVPELRRLLYCGEWIESHALHTFMLHAPDFLGYPDAIAMAKDHREWVEKALKLKKAGNDIVNVLGGREIHPINVKVGGFYRYPEPLEFALLREDLKVARQIAYDAAHWMAGLDFPDFEHDYEFLALHHPTEYAINEGRIVSSKGLNIKMSEYEEHFNEQHQHYSTTLHTVLDDDRTVMTGPLARFNLNYDQLSLESKLLAEAIGLKVGCTNPFRSLLVRMVETFYACDEALRILRHYEPPGITGNEEVIPKAGTGRWATEAPRGLLFHRYQINRKGIIKNARIVAPTSHNQRIIESDLQRVVEQYYQMGDQELTDRCEQSIRNYDPCISCSTHFLKVEVDGK